MQGTSTDLDPVTFADTAGSAYASGVTAAHRKAHGLYLTPPAVARFMAGFAAPRHGREVRVLDPCSGGGVLAAAAIAALVDGGARQVHVVAYEIDPSLAEVLEGVLTKAVAWASERETKVTFEIRPKDFVLANAEALAGHGGFFETGGSFDLVIATPPPISSSTRRTRVRRRQRRSSMGSQTSTRCSWPSAPPCCGPEATLSR